AIAIENARQYSLQAERVVELAGLQKIAGAISNLQEPRRLFAQLGERVAELMETEIGGVLLYDRDNERLVAQKPLYGVLDTLTSRYVIPLTKGSPARSLWEDVSFWFSNDVQSDHLVAELRLAELAELAGVQTVAMAAMTVGEERIGVLQVANKKDGSPFTLDDIRLLQTYADQAAIIVESARLYEEEQSRVAELQGLQQIVQAMSAFTNPEELYAQLAERIAELIGVEVCGFLIYEPEEDKLVARLPFYGVDQEAVREYSISLPRYALARQVWREAELYESNSVFTDETVDGVGLRELARRAGLQTLMLAPLSAGGRRFGLLLVANKSNGADFDDSDRRLLTIFAGQAAALIDNARLYQDTDATLRRRAAELRSVSRISRELNATLELKRILEVIATEAMRAEGAVWGSLVMFEWDETGTQIIPTMRLGMDLGEETRILELAAARSGETLVIDDFQKVAHYPSPIPEARSALIVPIHFEGRVVGTISLYGDRPGALGPDAAEFVQALSAQATIAVTNATRHAEQVERSELLRRRAEQLTRIFELGRAFRSDSSVETTLDSVARAIRDSAGFERVLISVLADNHRTLEHLAQAGLPEEVFERLSEQPSDWEAIAPYQNENYRLGGSYLIPPEESAKLFEALGLPQPETRPEHEEEQEGDWLPGHLLLVPLQASGGGLLGVLSVDQPRDGHLPDRETVDLLEIFANQAAIVIENNRLYTSMEQRAEELTRSLESLEKSYQELDRLSHEMIRKDIELSQVNELLNLRAQRLLALHRVMESVDTTHSPEEVLRDIADSVVREMDVDHCLIALRREEGDTFEVVAAAGPVPEPEELEKLLTGRDPITQAYREGEAVLYHLDRKSRSAAASLARALGAYTLAALPVPLGPSRSGVLLLGSVRDGVPFGEEDRDLFNLLASQIAVEYENARLYQAVQAEAATAAAERDRLQKLHLITTALQQTRDLEERLSVIARGIRSVGWERVALMLVDDNMEMTHLVTAGYGPEEEETLRDSLLTGEVWRRRFEDEAFMSMRVGSCYFLAHDHPWVREHLGAAGGELEAADRSPDDWHPGDQLYLPMYAGSEIIGLINLRDPVDGKRPTEDGLRSLELFVQQASSALENARLYQETLALKSYNEAVVQSIQQGIIVTDREGRIETVNAFLREQYGWGDDLIGQPFFEARPSFGELKEGFARVIESGEPVERPGMECPVADEVHTLNVYLYPRRDETGAVTGAVVLLEDVTQRARLEADIALRGRQLAALNEVSRRITATLSVDQVVSTALDQAHEIISYDRVTFWLRSMAGDALDMAGVRGYVDETGVPADSIEIEGDPLVARIIDEKQPLIIEDTHTDPRLNREPPPTMRSWLGAPMVSGGIVIGLLTFERSEAHAYAPADAQVAAAFANQVAVALENARLFEEAATHARELHNRTRRLAQLNRISATLGRSLDQQSILQTAVDEMAQALEIGQGCVIDFDPEAGVGRLTIQTPSNPDGSVDEIVVPLDNPIFEELRETKAPLVVEDLATDERAEALEAFVERRNVKSLLLTPLVVGNEVTGLIALEETEKPRSFRPEQVEVAQTITNQAAVSVQNARLFQETVARRAELSILFEAARIASSSLDLDNVVTSAARYYIRALDVDRCAIYLWDQAGDALKMLADFDREEGSHPVDEIGRRDNLSQYPATATVLAEQGVVTLEADDPDLSEREAEWLRQRGAVTMLVLPLVARDQTIGLVELSLSEGERRFNQREIRLARALSASVATAMENARLHDETQRRLQELSTINRISRTMTQAISAEDLYRMLQSELVEVLHTRSLTLVRRDPRTDRLEFPLALRNGLRIPLPARPYGNDLYSHVIEKGEPLLISRDVPARLKELGVEHIEEGLKSFLAVPLASGEKIIGVLAVEDYEREGAFEETDLRVLGPIAAQVAVSLENARLYSELEQRLSETTTLQEVTRVVNSALDLQEIFERVVRELASAFKYPLIGLFTLEDDTLIMQAQHGYTGEEIERLRRIPLGQGIVGRAARTCEPQFVEDVTQDPDYLPVQEWVRCEVAVPILSEDQILGVLAVQSGEEKPLTENDLQLLRTFAGQVATAMVNARLFAQMVALSEELEQRVEERTRELREERDRIDTLFRITVELTASLDLDRVLNRALELVGEAVGAEHGSLYLIDPQSDLLIHRAVMSSSEVLPPGGRQIPLGRHEGMAGWVMDNRQSILVDDVHLDPRWANVPGTEHNRSLLGAPLVANEEVLGCIFFTSDQEGAFNEGHVRLVEAAANQVATSINNAELYRLIRDQAERLGTMLRSQQTEAAKSQAILESIADGVMVSDQTGEIILFNAAAERILELRRDEVLGRPATDLAGLYGAGAERWAEMLRGWSEDPIASRSAYLSEQIEVGERIVSVHVSPVTHGDEFLGLVSVFRDITREVMADRIKTEFVSNVSHELRTPMTSIKGYADLLLLGAAGEVTPEQRRFLDIIKSNADRLSLLVNDLLDISRIEQGRVELDLHDVDLRELIDDVLAAIRGRQENEGRHLEFIADVPEDLPSIQADYDRVTQIITNLVSNAYQYTPDGGSVTVRVQPEDEGVQIDVIDTGIGIPEEDQRRIFDRFFRGEHPLVMQAAGTGLGLSIVQHLVEMHGGRVWFESEEGKGTTFSVWLPYRVREEKSRDKMVVEE
ncbi:MAG TPA: GAF domain-containing protein, partial [Chloroflexi bacterium]|nr:GAF domain-containing protein [Chloroflexota bacterium]